VKSLSLQKLLKHLKKELLPRKEPLLLKLILKREEHLKK
jgi:hypothetical protein